MIQHTEWCCQQIFPPELKKMLPGSLEQHGLQKTTTAFCMNGLPVPVEAGGT